MAVELSPVSPLVIPFAFYIVVLKLALVDGAVTPLEFALSMFLTHAVLAIIFTAVRPFLNSTSVLFVLNPFA